MTNSSDYTTDDTTDDTNDNANNSPDKIYYLLSIAIGCLLGLISIGILSIPTIVFFWSDARAIYQVAKSRSTNEQLGYLCGAVGYFLITRYIIFLSYLILPIPKCHPINASTFTSFTEFMAFQQYQLPTEIVHFVVLGIYFVYAHLFDSNQETHSIMRTSLAKKIFSTLAYAFIVGAYDEYRYGPTLSRRNVERLVPRTMGAP